MADFLFKQNNELTLLGNAHPLYKENTFLNKEIDIQEKLFVEIYHCICYNILNIIIYNRYLVYIL